MSPGNTPTRPAETGMKPTKTSALLALLWTSSLWAAPWKPYPEAQISADQWQDYYDSVVAEFGGTRDDIADAKLVLFTDEATHTYYAFTTADHPAHPAWITRKVVEQDGAISIQQIGYFAGDEEPFAALFDDYLALSDQLKLDLATQGAAQD